MSNTAIQIKLNGYLNKHINEICHVGYSQNSDNHCAHFVSHVLGMKFGFTCSMMIHSSKPAASIRVQEIFPRCIEVGAWESLDDSLECGLVFITDANNVNIEEKTMINRPRKHVGIFYGKESKRVWHYSNSRNKVVSQSIEDFSNHYRSPDNALFWGTFPEGISL